MLPLSPRQTQVLALICEGLSNKSIARKLNISEATVKMHASEILRRLGVHSRWEAALTRLRREGYEG